MADHPPVTMGEAARLLGISYDAVRQRIQRGALTTIRGNDGRRLVLLPNELTERSHERVTDSSTVTPVAQNRTDVTETERAELREQVRGLSHKLGAAEARAEELREHIATLKSQLAKAEVSADRERTERERLLLELERAREERAARIEWLTEEHGRERKRQDAEIAALREAVARLDRPWWRRLFTRERGR